VSVAPPPPAGAQAPASPSPPAAHGETCPLCGAPLHPEQEWCLRCGAAARTRLAASPNWKGFTATLAVVVALSLGVLAAALVKLAAGDSTPPATTRTVTVAAAATPASTASTPTTGLPASGATGASTPGAATTPASAATTPGSAAATSAPTGTTGTTPGATNTTKAKRKAKGFGLGKTVEELLRKRKLLPSTGTG
jgi:hypothetical protein